MAKKNIDRPRGYKLSTWVNEEEKAEIEALAEQAGMSVSSFLRAVGQNQTICGKADMGNVKELAKISADMGRIAGLLKLWLSSRRGEGAHPMTVEAMMADFRVLQKAMMDLIHEERER